MTPAPDLSALIRTVEDDADGTAPADLLVTAAGIATDLESTSDALLGHFVDRCRRGGMSWTEISAALGVSRQAAHKRFSPPSITFERFTQRARNAVEAAQREAVSRASATIAPSDLLLGLYAEPDGVAAKVLADQGLDREAARSALGATVASAPAGGGAADQASGPGFPRFAEATGSSLRAAHDAALDLGHNYIGTEHLLLGLLDVGDETTSSLLEGRELRPAIDQTMAEIEASFG